MLLPLLLHLRLQLRPLQLLLQLPALLSSQTRHLLQQQHLLPHPLLLLL
jgi:hypothetical protein